MKHFRGHLRLLIGRAHLTFLKPVLISISTHDQESKSLLEMQPYFLGKRVKSSPNFKSCLRIYNVIYYHHEICKYGFKGMHFKSNMFSRMQDWKEGGPVVCD